VILVVVAVLCYQMFFVVVVDVDVVSFDAWVESMTESCCPRFYNYYNYNHCYYSVDAMIVSSSHLILLHHLNYINQ